MPQLGAGPRRGICLWVGLAAAGSAFAQAPPPSPAAVHETAGATLVEIPVTVVGKDGRPVTGLTASDFQLYDEGKKQAITGLDVVDLGRPSDSASAASGEPPTAAAAEPVPPSARRLWLLVFDLSYSSPSSVIRAREGAHDFVTRSMPGADLAAVGTLSVDTGWKLLVNFTRDKAQLAAAIETLGAPALTRPSADPLAFAFSSPETSQLGTTASPHSKHEAALIESLRDLQALQRKSNDEQLRARATRLVGSLAGLGRVLDSVRGRKHVLFFSEGFESRLLTGGSLAGSHSGQDQAAAAQDTSTAVGAGNAAASGEIWKIDSDARFGSGSSRDILASALAQYARSDAVLDAVDIAGLRSGDDLAAKNEGGTDTLYTMAADTGGDFVRNANQLGGELEKVAARTSRVYLLLYSPKASTKPGAFHALKVEVKAPGAKVLARSGYYEPRPYGSLSRLEQVLSTGDLLEGGAGAPIQAHMTAAAFASQASAPQVPVVLEIPGRSLLEGDSGERSGVQIYAYANDLRGNLVDYFATELTLDLAKTRVALESGGLKLYGTLYLPPSDYEIRALVRNVATGRAGVASARLSIPPIPGNSPRVLPPFFASPTEGWLTVRATPRADAPDRPLDYPFALGNESFVPAVSPVLAANEEVRVAVVAYDFAAEGKPGTLAVAFRVVGADGRETPVEPRLEKSSDFERGGGQKRFYAFRPSGLGPGHYTLKVLVTEASSHASAESAGAFDMK